MNTFSHETTRLYWYLMFNNIAKKMVIKWAIYKFLTLRQKAKMNRKEND